MYTFENIAESYSQSKSLLTPSAPKVKVNKTLSVPLLTKMGDSLLQSEIRNLYEQHIFKFEFTSKSGYEFFKRAMDIAFCFLASPIALPLVIVFGLLVRLDSQGAIFYKQVRCGREGKFFNIYKIRSMVVEAEKNGAKWASKDDPRVTRIGKLIRKTRIDELPQLWNILKGDMSLIGPRPERPEIILGFSGRHPYYIARNFVKPGVSGWAQINGGYEHTPREKFVYDVYYINNRNILLDINIMVRTIGIVVTGHGAY